jgi:kynureninase
VSAPIYAAAHSLGPPLPGIRAAVASALSEWSEELVDGWDHWIDLAGRVGDRLGASGLGAGAGQVVVCDSVTVNLYKLASAALDARPDRRSIVVDDTEFPTDRYVLEGLAQARGLEIRRVPDETTAVVCRSLVDFRTSELHDLDEFVTGAHAVGALALVDLCHVAGIVPVDLDASGVDLAVGCTYKWLCAGPGAPAFLYVRRDLQDTLRQPIWGWFGQRDQFAMGPVYDPEPDIRRFQTGTPSILGLAAVGAAADVDVAALRETSLARTSRFIERVRDVVTPVARRGGHVAIRCDDAERVLAALAERGVVADVRGDLVRFGFHPATTSLDDVDAAAAALAELTPET